MKQSHDSKMRAMEQSIMASYRTKMDEMKESYDNKMDVMKQSITQSITASYQTTIDDKVSLYAADIVKLQMQLSVLVTKNEFIQRKLSGASLHAKDVPGLKTQTSALEAEIKSIHQKIAGTFFTQSVGYNIDKFFQQDKGKKQIHSSQKGMLY